MLPADVVRHHLAGQLPARTLLDLCATTRTYRDLCQNEDLWRRLYATDFPRIPRVRPTWFESYRYMHATFLRRVAELALSYVPIQRKYLNEPRFLADVYRAAIAGAREFLNVEDPVDADEICDISNSLYDIAVPLSGHGDAICSTQEGDDVSEFSGNLEEIFIDLWNAAHAPDQRQ